jgi:hypothetical protein
MANQANSLDPEVLRLLEVHRTSFHAGAQLANDTGQPVPTDTRAWSQILASLLTGIKGPARKKGADLLDGSDVKAANVWMAIDTPRFNGCLKSGRVGERGSLSCLDDTPMLIFVLWDNEPETGRDRCRVWVVRPPSDIEFRKMAERWYKQRDEGEIISDNFQLHPPRNRNANTFRNTCGNLDYPLLLEAHWTGASYEIISYSPEVLKTGQCTPPR